MRFSDLLYLKNVGTQLYGKLDLLQFLPSVFEITVGLKLIGTLFFWPFPN